MAQKYTIINTGVITEYDTEAEYNAAKVLIEASFPPPDPGVVFMISNTKKTFEDESAGGFVPLNPTFANVVCASGGSPLTIDVATFPIPENIFGKTRIEVFIVDAASGAFGIAEIVVSWRRFTSNPAIGTVHPIIALQTPTTLSGASLPALVIVNNTIVSRFTGAANRTINVYVKYSPTVLKF